VWWLFVRKENDPKEAKASVRREENLLGLCEVKKVENAKGEEGISKPDLGQPLRRNRGKKPPWGRKKPCRLRVLPKTCALRRGGGFKKLMVSGKMRIGPHAVKNKKNKSRA